MNLNAVNIGLAQMRGEALAETGFRLVEINRSIATVRSRLERAKAFCERTDKRAIKVSDRLSKKTARLEGELEALLKKRELHLYYLTVQREAMGITEHGVIYEFYGEHHEKNRPPLQPRMA